MLSRFREAYKVKNTAQLVFLGLVYIAPALLLTLKHAVNSIILLLSIYSVSFLIQASPIKSGVEKSKLRLLISLTLAGPFLSVLLGEVLRGRLEPQILDAPLRMFLCVPIFLAVSKGLFKEVETGLVSMNWFKFAFPLAAIWILVIQPAWVDDRSGRLTTYFVDPQTFGSYGLFFSFVSFATVLIFWKGMAGIHKAFLLLGTLAGLSIGVLGGSRNGWLDLPFFILAVAYYHMLPSWGFKKTVLISVGFISVALGLIALEPYLVNKFLLAYREIAAYKWNEMNPDESVTMRISMYRMAFFYFLQEPLKGFGDFGWMGLMNSPELLVYADQFTREFPTHGFHNEILTSMVKSGIWGLASALALFVVPFILAVQGLRNAKGQIKLLSLYLMLIVVHRFISGMTSEVTNLVFLSSFMGLMWAVLLGEYVWLRSNSSNFQSD